MSGSRDRKHLGRTPEVKIEVATLGALLWTVRYVVASTDRREIRLTFAVIMAFSSVIPTIWGFRGLLWLFFATYFVFILNPFLLF